jgi:3-phytase
MRAVHPGTKAGGVAGRTADRGNCHTSVAAVASGLVGDDSRRMLPSPAPRPSRGHDDPPRFVRVVTAAVLAALAACAPRDGGDRDTATAAAAAAALPLATDTLVPAVVTQAVLGDSDDPAIWIDTADVSRSLVLGTDKGDTTGGVYAFDLAGRIDSARTVRPLMRMNNVDVATGLAAADGRRIDIAVATERRRQAIRVFSLPDMRAIDGGGIVVFDGDTTRAPMGVALWTRPRDGAVFAIVGGKSGPATGYLWQYRLELVNGTVRATRVRAFGAYSGKKEIEAILVDDATGMVYYSDETVGVRQYHADPDSGDAELALFATSGVVSDHEGLAIYPTSDTTGYIVLSDQQGHRIQVFAREGRTHPLLAVIPVRANETDGLDITARNLGPRFPAGMLVMMNDPGTFHYYDWRDVQRAIDATRARSAPRAR